MGSRRALRAVDGVLLLDKPPGLSSNQALQRVKRLFRARKAGHTGSLDPLATGVLPICFGEATKLSSYLLESDKAYRSLARLGQRTATGDAEGAVLETRPVPSLTPAEIEQALAAFRGEIEQIPPMYSALKHQGRRLYELARAGEVVERAPRSVTIHALDLLAAQGETLDLYIRCSKGTYVRTLVEDIGERLGCGAHVEQLRRTGVGPYSEAEMHGLPELEALAERGDAALDAALLPLGSAVADWPAVHLDRDSAHYLRQGQPVQVPGAPTAGRLAVFGPDGRFLGVGEVMDDGRVAPRRLVASPA
jgi:tRNA pseudouridine55 synthase